MPLMMARILDNLHEFMRTYAGEQRDCYLQKQDIYYSQKD